jgi:hypothetical protein
VQVKWFCTKKGCMNSNLKLNWINSSSIKPWRPYDRKKSVLALKSKILSIFNMDVKRSKKNWAFRSQWRNPFAIWSYKTKFMTTSVVFLPFYHQMYLWRVEENQWVWIISGQVIKAWRRCLFTQLVPLEFVH